MTIIKPEYSTNFNVKSGSSAKEFDELFDLYLNEFFSSSSTIEEFIAMFLNITRDFLDSKIDERTLGMLVHKSLVSSLTKHFYEEPYLWKYNDILSFINEIMDIDWAKESDNYSDYLDNLKNRWLQLIKIYN